MLTRRITLVALALMLIAGCAVRQEVKRPEGPFEVVLFATSDTRGELEPCG